jgi:ATP-dependent RNA helicase DeaD
VHRIGRTGRAGREGVAITLAEAREHRLLRNIEFHTKRKIATQAVPTVHDLRARRLELTKAALEEAIENGGLETYRRVVESLANEHDLIDLAAAAVKIADMARDGTADTEEIPTIPLPSERPFNPNPAGGGMRLRPTRIEPRAHSNENESGPARKRGDSTGMTKIYIGVGRGDGVRPGDLVGAIANEAHINSREIGAINITDKFSLVEVAEQMADDVILALRGTTIRGKKVNARLDKMN